MPNPYRFPQPIPYRTLWGVDYHDLRVTMVTPMGDSDVTGGDNHDLKVTTGTLGVTMMTRR